MGFQSQAFVDIKYDISVEKENGASQDSIKRTIANLPGVILIYTVFGDIDLRCKIVGWDLKEIEDLAMKIRKIPGVASSSTDIIVDETVYKEMRQSAGKLLEKDKLRIGSLLSIKK